MKNNKIILIFLGVILTFILVLFFNKDKNNLENSTIFEKIKKEINKKINIENKKDSSFTWFKNGYIILVPADDSFYIKKNNDYLEFNDVPNLFENEINTSKTILQDNGFILNKENSSKNFSDKTFYDYIQSYQKDYELCVIKINPDNLGYYQMNFSCGNSLSQAYEEQLPFLDALNYKNTNNFVHLINKSGDFYQIGIGSYRGGSTAVLKKENDFYRVLYTSQEGPNCEEIEGENIPKETLDLFKINGCWKEEKGFIKFDL